MTGQTEPNLSSVSVKYQGIMLTSREIECLMLAIENKTLLQIGQHLNINPRTVCFYLTNVSNKLAVLTAYSTSSRGACDEGSPKNDVGMT